MTCDFRVECGRCESENERNVCSDVWISFGVLYLSAFISICSQLALSKQKRSLFWVVLGLWAIACFLRTLNGVILAFHVDRFLHPIILELLWHSVWLFGCFGLTHFIMVVLNCWFEIKRMRIGAGIPILRFNAISNCIWAFVFISLSILDGLSPEWPRTGNQFFAWMCCALYLCLFITYVAFKLVKGIEKRLTRKPKPIRPSIHKVQTISHPSPSPVGNRTASSLLTPRNANVEESCSKTKESQRSSDRPKLTPKSAGRQNPGLKNQKSISTQRTNAVFVLKLFVGTVTSGLAMYFCFLLALGVVYTQFRDTVDLTGETIIVCFHQSGMLFMGLGMQLAVAFNIIKVKIGVMMTRRRASNNTCRAISRDKKCAFREVQHERKTHTFQNATYIEGIS
mmetsp:Transcript_12661/g.20110  ORF Transcript_12661/g.20110 Transcript_12661/m.20110 type:complete len:396 (-) Transcript_12661:69-1256(-)